MVFFLRIENICAQQFIIKLLTLDFSSLVTLGTQELHPEAGTNRTELLLEVLETWFIPVSEESCPKQLLLCGGR